MVELPFAEVVGGAEYNEELVVEAGGEVRRVALSWYLSC